MSKRIYTRKRDRLDAEILFTRLMDWIQEVEVLAWPASSHSCSTPRAPARL